MTAPSPAFGGTSTTSSAVFGGGALSAVSSPPQPGQTFSFNATGVSSGGVQSQNASTVMPSPAAAPSFVFGSTTPDSQPQQQQQPAFSLGAGSGVVGQSGMAFGQVRYLFNQATTDYCQPLPITRGSASFIISTHFLLAI